MANDGISMRGNTRTESLGSSRDAGQISGSNQTLSGLLSGAGDNGFQQVLDVQVQRKAASAPLIATRKDTSTNDKARRPGGNNSPPTSAQVSQPREASSKRNIRPADRGAQATEQRSSAERNEAPATHNRAAPHAKSAVRKSTQSEKPAESSAAGGANASGVSRVEVEKGRTDSPDEASTPVSNQDVPAQGASGVVTAESSVESAGAGDTGQDAAPGNVATETGVDVSLLDLSVAGQAMVLETTSPAVEITVTVEGDASLASTQTAVSTVNTELLLQTAATNPAVATTGLPQGVATSDSSVTQTPTESANAAVLQTMGTSASTVGDSGVNSPLSNDVNTGTVSSTTDETPDPALKDLLTAMIRNRDQAAAAKAAANSNADAARQAAAESTDAAASNLAALAREFQRAGKPAAGNTQAASTSATSTGQQAAGVAQGALTATNITVGTADSSDTLTPPTGVALNSGATPDAEKAVTAPVTDIAIPSGDTDDIDALRPPDPENDGAEVTIAQEGGEDAVMSPDSVTAATDSPTESIDAAPMWARDNRSPSGTRPASDITPSAPAIDASATPAAVDSGAESWSILDEVVVDTAETADGKTAPVPQQQDQPLTLVRNELRNLERFVDAGLQGTVARSVARKDEKANDIKPAALSRALESLGAGAKAADLRPGVTVSSTPVAFGRQGFAEQMAEKIMLMTTQKVQVAEIRLDPKEMGTIDVKIRVHQDQASVVFSSPHPQVREALEASLPRLREMFADAGVGLGSVNVNDRGASSGGNEQSSGRGEGSAFAGIDDPAEDRGPKAPRQTNGLVDYYA